MYLLQTRTGKRSAGAQLKIACDLVRGGLITPGEAVTRTASVDIPALAGASVSAAEGDISQIERWRKTFQRAGQKARARAV